MLGRSDAEQLSFATTLRHCILTHNRLDFEQLHKHYLANHQPHAGILIGKRKNAYEIAERVAILLDTLTSDPKSLVCRQSPVASRQSCHNGNPVFVV